MSGCLVDGPRADKLTACGARYAWSGNLYTIPAADLRALLPLHTPGDYPLSVPSALACMPPFLICLPHAAPRIPMQPYAPVCFSLASPRTRLNALLPYLSTCCLPMHSPVPHASPCISMNPHAPTCISMRPMHSPVCPASSSL